MLPARFSRFPGQSQGLNPECCTSRAGVWQASHAALHEAGHRLDLPIAARHEAAGVSNRRVAARHGACRTLKSSRAAPPQAGWDSSRPVRCSQRRCRVSNRPMQRSQTRPRHANRPKFGALQRRHASLGAEKMRSERSPGLDSEILALTPPSLRKHAEHFSPWHPWRRRSPHPHRQSHGDESTAASGRRIDGTTATVST